MESEARKPNSDKKPKMTETTKNPNCVPPQSHGASPAKNQSFTLEKNRLVTSPGGGGGGVGPPLCNGLAPLRTKTKSQINKLEGRTHWVVLVDRWVVETFDDWPSWVFAFIPSNQKTRNAWKTAIHLWADENHDAPHNNQGSYRCGRGY